MASVSSLDQDMRNLRMSRYTDSAANEARGWIEDSLGERLPNGDLLDALKDGVALCKLIKLAVPSSNIKSKQSAMPFVQMENISNFLRACESPPFMMPAHDRFLTVDLYEHKDPAQVLQCLSAFSRVANATNPAKFPTTIGPRKAGVLSPSTTGSGFRNGATSPYVTTGSKPASNSPYARPMSPVKTGGSTTSSATGASVSSWSKKTDQGVTSPAWNIAQYGYMGGASQGNQGVSFGARRQITSAGPNVPNSADKERRRREKDEEDQRLKIQAEEAEQKRLVEREADEERERAEEERRWADETKRHREDERQRLAEQKQQWEEQERKWKVEEEARQREEAELVKQTRPTALGDARLKGQYLSQYQSEQTPSPQQDTPERRRVQELEKQLEEARERERQYQVEREQRNRHKDDKPLSGITRAEQARPSSSKDSEASWAPDEREYQRQAAPSRLSGFGSTRPLPAPSSTRAPMSQPQVNETRQAPSLPAREEVPVTATPQQQQPPPPPEAEPEEALTQSQTRTERFLTSNPAPVVSRPQISQPAEMGYTTTMEQQTDTDRRIASQQKTKAGGWASKSLLEREMERERERQKEWESNQEASRNAARDGSQGSGPGQSWDVHQYGFAGGDSQNRGSSTGSGIAFGGRRQIIGPRPQPGK